MRVLVVDDELSMREYLDVLISRSGHQVITADGVADAERKLLGADLVISDMKLANRSGLEVLKAARALQPAPEVILITAYGTPTAAVEAMRQGAYDYIAKPFDNDELMLLVQKALEKKQILRENERLKATLLLSGKSFFLGDSAQMRKVWSLVDKVAAASRSTVLITGESGTGKEVIARALHFKSSRAGHPFVPVNCGALAEGLLESELFGHVKGAFTGANQDRPGLLVSAEEGTVMLDEIGEMSLSMQVKLLRVLQERRLKPVGATTEVPFEARVLAATNRNLEEEVRAGRFREDLFHRLNVLTIEVPPLRERREDIAPLARFFLLRFARDLGRPGLYLTNEAVSALERFAFPGNVRQLENVIERAATLADQNALGPDALPPALRGVPDVRVIGSEVELADGFSLERHLDEEERRYLFEALKRANGSKTKAAELVGLTFRSFRYRLAKHGISDRDEA